MSAPNLSPVRPPGFYQSVHARWSRTAEMLELTESEVALCAAQFCGQVIGAMHKPIEQQNAYIEVCKQALDTAFATKKLTDSGASRSRAP